MFWYIDIESGGENPELHNVALIWTTLFWSFGPPYLGVNLKYTPTYNKYMAQPYFKEGEQCLIDRDRL